MSFDLSDQLAKFRFFKHATFEAAELLELAPDIFRYSPHHARDSKIKIGFIALTHGNEILGLPILIELLQFLHSGRIKADFEIYFALGNVAAALSNKRFVEKDLNRCFGQNLTTAAEDLRARQIEQHVLNHVDYCIDLHQTIQDSLSPFFIFQYATKNCLKHLSLMNLHLPTILQFDAIGDASQGLSTDEYLRSRGKFGVALELGEKGFSAPLMELGKNTCLRFLIEILKFKAFEDVTVANLVLSQDIQFYKLTHRMASPENGSSLKPGFANLEPITAGSVIGKKSNGDVVLAEENGFILFPHTTETVEIGKTLFYHCCKISLLEINVLTSNELLTSPLEQPALS